MQIKNELKKTFTSYWEYLTLRAACQLNIFDKINDKAKTIEQLVKQTNTNNLVLEKLVFALIDFNTIYIKGDKIYLTQRGELLTDKHPESMKQACILWGNEHLRAWQDLTYTVKTGKPVFDKIYGESFFDYLRNNEIKLDNYHKAMAEYAIDDYKNILEMINFSKYNTISDIGGGLGVLIEIIAKIYINKKCVLFELPEVIDLIKAKNNFVRYVKGDFFKPLNFKSDALLLSRILHDWNDDKATIILRNCYNALPKTGELFIMEIMQDEVQANTLSLNMLLMTESYERSFNQYKKLLINNGFEIIDKKKINDLQTILIAQKI